MAQNSQAPFKVVIDAGHGNQDPGCIGSTLKEKDVNLTMALKIGKLISDNCPNVQVIYTRKTDVFLELYRRAQIANTNHADLFISIHCNAAEDHSANGTETFVMGLAKSEANQAVARKENAAILKEKDYKNNYDGFNPDSPESNVVFSLYSSAYLNNSIILADKVQKNLINATHLNDRGVKQAGYWVLYKVAMPSILVELGFLSNLKDEAYIAQKENQDRIAQSIYNAFIDYYATVHKGQEAGQKVSLTPGVQPVVATPAPSTTTTPGGTTATPKADAPASKNAETTSEAKTEEQKAALETPKEPEIRFKVQFLASPEKLSLTEKRFNGIYNIGRFQENNFWKYTSGNETTLDAANQVLAEVKKIYPDAFVIAFQGDKKISVKEAQQLLKK